MIYRVKWDPDASRRLMRNWSAAKQPDAGIQAFDKFLQPIARRRS